MTSLLGAHTKETKMHNGRFVQFKGQTMSKSDLKNIFTSSFRKCQKQVQLT